MAIDFLDVAECERLAALGSLAERTQADLGKFFTPAVAARLIGLMPCLPENGSLHILESWARSGVLSAALIARILNERADVSVELLAIERDPMVTPHLMATLTACTHVDKIAWESEVWCADHSTHMIHYNVERFLGPYEQTNPHQGEEQR